MPRHIEGADRPQVDLSDLVDGLKCELQQPKALGQPVILEDRTPETHSVRVHVIWDRWVECPRQLRSSVIDTAYEQSGEIAPGEMLTMSLGLTVPEATSMGLLPFQVLSARKREEQPSLEEYRQAAIEAGASTLQDPERPQLRFARQEHAEQAIERLQAVLPGSKWIIAKEVAASGDY